MGSSTRERRVIALAQAPIRNRIALRSVCQGVAMVRELYTLAIGLCLAISGCAGIGQNAESVRAAMVGMNERELISCLGPPDDVSFSDERNYFLYRLEFHLDSDLRPSDLKKPARCNLLFQFDQGSVAGVGVRGLNFEGVNANFGCTMLLNRCLESASIR